jgi:hypothetical protein
MKYGREVGKGIYSNALKEFLKNSYSKNQKSNIDGYKRDESLSGQRVQVYNNPLTNDAYVVHRGTQGLQDILTDFKLAFFPKLYLSSTRFNHAQDIQQQAEKKYGKDHITTLGHSLGAKLTSDVGSNSKELITYNKPILPYDMLNQTKGNETSIRTKLDPVSVLGSFNPNIKQVSTKTINPITAHNLDQLDNIDNEYIGKGRVTKQPKFKKELSNFDIIDICKQRKIPLINVIAKDEEMLLKINGNYVINLQNHDQKGSHWTTLVMTKNDCIYVDSFGQPPPQEVNDFLKNKYKKESINYNTMIIQNLKSTYCGYFCIAFLKSNKENKNKGLLQKLKIFQNIFSTDTNKNDNLLVKYFYL